MCPAMLTYTSALLAGPYDWLSERIPPGEFERRIDAVRAILHARGIAGMILHGRSIDYAAMAYLTGFVPKLNAAFALMGRDGQIRILFSGGASMAESAKRLTFVEDVRGLTDLTANVATWCEEQQFEAQDIALWDGSALSKDHHNQLMDGLGTNRLIEFNDQLDPLRRSKSAVERSAIAKAAIIVSACFAAAEQASKSGDDVRAISLAAEHAGYQLGAQDVRIRISITDQGYPNIVPDMPTHAKQDSFNIYAAARVFGYWAQAATTLGAGTLLRQRAHDVIAAYIDALAKDKATVPHNFLRGMEHADHLSIEMSGIGLSLCEKPMFTDYSSANAAANKRLNINAPPNAALADGEICSIIAEARDGICRGFASALIAVTRDDVQTLNLWP